MARWHSLILAVAFCSLAILRAAAAPGNNGGFDHRAHAVPGGPYDEPDTDSDGFAWVTMNGELSHSHFFNSKTGATGKVVKYKWIVGSKVICRRMVCSSRFPVGRTTVKLEVVDNTGDVASSTTSVNVFKGAKPALRLWYYQGNGWIPDRPTPKVVPTFSQTLPRINFGSKNAFPNFVRNQKFSIRALGNIDLFKQGNYRFRLGCGGAACTLWIGNTLVAAGKNKVVDSKPMMFSKGMRKLHAIYRRQSPKGMPPRFTLSWMLPGSKGWNLISGKFLSHNPSAYAPVVHSVKLPKATVGSVITISGSSLQNVRNVKIGALNCAGPVSKSQFIVTCVVPGGRGKQKLFVTTTQGRSNAVPFEILGGPTKTGSSGGTLGYYQPIKFRNDFLKKGGKVWRAAQLTAITLGPDNKYYMGSLNGIVHVVQTDLGNQVTGYCKSSNVGKARSILGVAFNPAENGIVRLYASTSVLYWGTKKLLPFNKGWSNGEVIAMQKTKKACLARVSTVISGLPVSNYDHAVNGITFDHSGNLLVTVGGSSNAGVSKRGDALGGVPDSPFSGSMVIAGIRKKGFNGKLIYNQYQNPGTASRKSGSVAVYASGMRNSWCHTAHSNGHIYATDNGANANFGLRSTGCNAAGGVRTEPDTLKKVRQGGYYGYANRNRGRFDKRQCIHRPPQANMGGYTKPIAKLESSTDGVIEYTANTFGAQMRGDLLLTKFAVSGNGKVFRVQLNGQGDVKSKFEVSQFSGLTVAMSHTGGLVMPRVYQSRVAMMLPIERNPGSMVVTSVNPFRGPKRGGGVITITGWNLRPPLTVSVGGKACRNVGNFKNGRSLTCIVPKGSGKASVVVTRFGKKSTSYGYDYMYMKV